MASRAHDMYGPASLDFINLPNPVEPHTAAHKHPLDGPAHLERGLRHDNLRSLLAPGPTKPLGVSARRRIAGGRENALDLPRLPERQGDPRTRIPPTLTGLHQPPPDAGILPSISVDKPSSSLERLDSLRLPERHGAEVHQIVEICEPEPRQPSKPETFRTRRKKWTELETADLLKGVAQFGVGQWTQILNCPDYHFNRRTAQDLKDRFRVCRPDDYGSSRSLGERRPLDVAAKPKAIRPSRRALVTGSKLQALGIEGPFQQSTRRKRRDYSAEEDEAIRQGFEKYHTSWSAILQDRDFKILASRKPRDLRDRFRTLFPAKYKGLSQEPKAAEQNPRVDDTVRTIHVQPVNASTQQSKTVSRPQADLRPEIPGLPREQSRVASSTRKQDAPAPSSQSSDVFWSVALEGGSTEVAGAITLDRGILNWPFDETAKTSTSGQAFYSSSQTVAAAQSNLPPEPATTALPRLAAVTAGNWSDYSIDEQLELPSLMLGLGQLDNRAWPHSLFE